MNGDYILCLLLFSCQVMQVWWDEDNFVDFYWWCSGKLIIYCCEYDFNKVVKGIDFQYQQVLNVEVCLQLELVFKYISFFLQGGIYLSGDEMVDCYQFCFVLFDKFNVSSDFSLLIQCEVW